MAIERIFIKEGMREADVEEYLSKRFDKAGYSHTEIQRTPLGMRIIVYANKPGLVIGRSGRRIDDITEEIKKKFGFENPLVDVKEVEQPLLDAQIVAKRIAKALERGINFKKVANYYLERVMEAGAIGIQINVGGKLMGSERSRFQKFKSGFVKHSGEYADTMVRRGMAQANIKPGIVGIKVKIMKEMPKEYEEKEYKVEKEIEKKENNS